MSSRTIGKIVSIGTNGIVAEVYDSLGSYVNTVDGIRFVGEVGSYVSIYEIGRTIIAEIESVAEKSSIVNGHNLNKANSNRQIFLNLIGEIIDNKFFFGVSILRTVHVYGTWKGKTCDVFLYFQKDYYRGATDINPAAFVWIGRAWRVYCGTDFQCDRWIGMLYYHDCDRVSQTWQGIKLFLWIKQRCNTCRIRHFTESSVPLNLKMSRVRNILLLH